MREIIESIEAEINVLQARVDVLQRALDILRGNDKPEGNNGSGGYVPQRRSKSEKMLRFIRESNRPVSGKEIAMAAGCTMQAVYMALDKMIEHGLVGKPSKGYYQAV